MKLLYRSCMLLVCLMVLQLNSLNAEAAKKHLQALLKQLDSPQRQKRVEAEEALLSLGLVELTQWEGLQVESAAARETLRRIRLKLEAEQTEVLFQPSRVTIRPTDSLNDIASRWRERNQVGLNDGLPLRQPLGIELTNVTFWESIHAVKQEIDFNWDWTTGESGTRLLLTKPQNSLAHAHTQDGIFLSQAYLKPQRGNFKNPRIRRIQRVHCEVTVEPRIHLFYAKLADAEFSLYAGDTKIAPFSPNSKREVTSEDGHSVKYTIDFLKSDSPPQNSLNFKGTLRAWCAGQTTPVSFQINENLPVTKKTATSSVTLQSLDIESKRNTICTVIADLDLPKDVFTSHRLGMLHQAMLVESSGIGILPSEVGLVSIDGAHTIRYTFPRNNLSNSKLVYFVPEYIAERTIKINIPNVMPGAQ